MKKTFAILGIAAIAATACSRETLHEVSTSASEGTRLVFTATTDEAEVSKTTLGTGGVVKWSGTDQIQVNAGTVNETNTFTIASCDGNTATFEGSVTTAGSDYYALYPASAYVLFDVKKAKFQFNVPSEQTARLGGFADGVNIAVAHTSGSGFTFLNVLSYVYFDLQQDNITKVELTTGGTSDTDYLAGETCKIQVAKDATGGDGLTYSDNPGGTRYKTVSIGDGSTVLAKGVYYLALFPNDRTNRQAKLKGFTMTLTNNEGMRVGKTSTKTLTVARGAARNLGTLSGFEFSNSLKTDKSVVKVSADTGSTTINVTSSTSWTAAISGEGFSIDNTSGSGSGTITVSYTENTSAESTRSATLTITSSDQKLEPVTVSFTQLKKGDPEPGQGGDLPGGAQVGDVPLDGLYGFGEKVTGGTGADASHIFYFTDGKALQTWLLARQKIKDTTPAMVYLTGTFNSDDGRSSSSPWFDVKDTDNITFIGLDDFTMNQIGFFCVRAKNIVIRNVYIKMPKASNGADGISMQECDGVWVDHCTFESLNQTSDYEDGSCDITHASTNVTVSWCKFIKTQKSCLVGHSSSASGDVAIKATFHHNWFSQSSSRHPRVRYGTCHVYNNLYDGCTTYGVGSACGAMVLAEYNIFNSVALPTDIATFPAKCVKGTWKSNLTDKVAGYLYTADNSYENRPAQDPNIQYEMYPMTNTEYTTYGGTATTNYQYKDFQPSYSYTVDAIANLRTKVENGSGTGKLGYVTYPAGAIKNAGITDGSGEGGSGEGGDEPGGDEPGGDEPGGDEPESGDDGSAHTYKIYYDGGVIQTKDGVSGASYFTSSESKADFSKDYSASSYTVEGVSYSCGLKFDSKGYVTFTTSADYDSSVRFYFTARKTGTTAKIQLVDANATAEEDPVATFSADWGTVGESGEVALGRSKTYTIKQISTEQGLIVAVVTEE